MRQKFHIPIIGYGKIIYKDEHEQVNFQLQICCDFCFSVQVWRGRKGGQGGGWIGEEDRYGSDAKVASLSF